MAAFVLLQGNERGENTLSFERQKGLTTRRLHTQLNPFAFKLTMCRLFCRVLVKVKVKRSVSWNKVIMMDCHENTQKLVNVIVNVIVNGL